MAQIQPDNESKHGLHLDRFWPGLVHSIWSLGPVELRRERNFAERQNVTLKTEGWLAMFKLGRHRFGFKWERDINANS